MQLVHYLTVVRKWLWLIVLAALLAGGAAFVVSRASTQIYRSTLTLLVNQASSSSPVTDYSSLLASQQLAKTYSELLKKRPTLDAVIQNLKLDGTADRLLEQLQISPVRDTTLISVSVEDPDPVRATAIANEIGTVFVAQVNATQRSRFSSSEQNLSSQLQLLQGEIASTEQGIATARQASPPNADEVTRLESRLLQYQESYSNLLKSYEDLRLAEARLTDNVQVAESAVVPERPVRPQTLLNTLLAAVVGVMLATLAAFLIEYLDDTVKGPDDVSALQVTNLGLITRMNAQDAPDKLIVLNEPRSPAAEAFRSLRTNIQFASVDRALRVLMITSAGPGEGKSTVAANLAAALAQAGQRVVLVDADLRRASVQRLFKMSNSAGLTDSLIQDGGSLNGSLRPTRVEHLQLLMSGALPPNPAELLASDRVGVLLKQLQEQVDIVVLDTPPCLVVTDAVALSKRADGVLVVVEAGKTRRAAMEQTLKTLRQVGAPVLGTVLNKYSARAQDGYYGYEYQYYSTSDDATLRKAQPAAKSKLGQWLNRLNPSHGNSSSRSK